MSADFSSHLSGNNLICLRPMFPIIKKQSVDLNRKLNDGYYMILNICKNYK